MKITFFCISFPVASETFIQKQIISFIKMGYDVSVLSLYPGDMTRIHEDFYKFELEKKTTYVFSSNYTFESKLKILSSRAVDSINCLTLKKIKCLNFYKYGHLVYNLLLPSIVGRMNKVHQADYFIAHFGTCGVIANYLKNIGFLEGKVATVFHGFDISAAEVLLKYKKHYDNLFSSGDLFFPISNLWKDRLVSLGCEPSKIQVIRMGIEVESFSYNKRNISDSLNIVSVCRLTEKKGIEYVIRACSYLKKENVLFKYTIVGYGPLEVKLRNLISELNLQDNIEILGFQSQDKVKMILDKSNVFALPSVVASNGDMEGIPVALMEAMASGLPVISTYHSGIPELIENNVNGYLCEEKMYLRYLNVL
ncbi:GDP-mannose-dependent alpha-(1-6)-phosphatidylinositol monomannoside mannosyltransferase [Klebsiella huaxiensis]|uniref:glycosyltransferase n=1 Tax=Klebsiella huaxiensis TaxID=2153354 RepID=UPI001157722A|nr:glycosyltransferase [Klebsiella huaxiensis]VUS83915.1 GDP-mannose-dependent alpha-(1-6)-phosphatidylinositol monomannoside mannosyltransferase [Klebsiella huaxiensis]